MIGATLMMWEAWVTGSGVTSEVLAIRRGDRDAFASLLARYKNRVYRYLLRMVCDPATAEDLFQQTWLQVLENIRRYDPKRNFEAWLFAVARNAAIDHLRRFRPESLDETPDTGISLLERIPARAGGALDHLMSSERTALVQKSLEALSPIHREILSLRFEEEMKLEEIAEVLGVPLPTVKSRLCRALERLRTMLSNIELTL